MPIDSYGLFSGKTELSLANAGWKIDAHTDQLVILQFWRCLMTDPAYMCEIISHRAFKFHSIEFNILQERLPTYGDQYYRSCLFFLLNRCSSTGQVSCGEFNGAEYSPLALKYLKAFKRPQAFDVRELNAIAEDTIADNSSDNFILFPTLKYSNNLLDVGKSIGYDTYLFNHRKLRKFIESEQKKTALVYNYHPKLLSFYKNSNVYLIDKYANLTNSTENYEEAIVTNF